MCTPLEKPIVIMLATTEKHKVTEEQGKKKKQHIYGILMTDTVPVEYETTFV